MDWGEKKLGININGRRLTNFRFAYHIVLFAKSAKELELMLNELNIKSKEVCLRMNASKTKLMSSEKVRPVIIDGITVEQLITAKKNGENELSRRITQAWRKFHSKNSDARLGPARKVRWKDREYASTKSKDGF